MFLLCPLPKIKILCNVPPFLYLCELRCYDIVFPVPVRWDCIKNVSCFLRKKSCVRNISHVYYNDVINCKQVLSDIMFAYQTTCGCIDQWNILLLREIWLTAGVLSKNLIFDLGFYVGECPDVQKKEKIGCGLIFYVGDCLRFYKYSWAPPCDSFWREKLWLHPFLISMMMDNYLPFIMGVSV
jgi:hypothetical protein